MADPVGEDGWLALVDEASRTASDLEQRVGVVELYKRAIAAEPWSNKLWLAYCEWIWSLHTDCQNSDAGWPEEEQLLGQELFSLETALDVWQQGAQAIKYRINDSHELWNRWLSIELEQLSTNAAADNVNRVRNIFFDRLQTPHASWDDTSQMFSTFLSKYDEAAWEATMVETTKLSTVAKALYNHREVHELKLQSALQSGDAEAVKSNMLDYLEWEMGQAERRGKKGTISSPLILCVALFERTLSSAPLGLDSAVWEDYIVFLLTARGDHPEMQVPAVLSVIQRGVNHCPWSGNLWARYILSAESEELPFTTMEQIKHAATNTNDLDRDGMSGVVEFYIAWCGYLKRRTMLEGATDEDLDIAEMGLPTALEDVQQWGKRRHGKEWKGDPLFRIERILIQHLTQKQSFEEARGYWRRLAQTHGESYEFWQQYYLWEMTIRTPNSPPTLATDVLTQAVSRKGLDWPEKMMEIYVRHCNNFENVNSLLKAINTVHRQSKRVLKRREREAAEAAAIYAQQAPTVQIKVDADETDLPSSVSKRKRDQAPEDMDRAVTKKPKNLDAETLREQHLKRDRENTTVVVTNLPAEVTQTKVRQYFKEYGHINSIALKTDADGLSSSALLEFRTPEDVQSALLRDEKYFVDKQIRVKSGVGLTLYVTNFPPTADDTYLRKLFADCGEIFSMRWPSLKHNTHRRFCYVSFRTAEAAAAATQLDGQSLGGVYKLVAKYSDPGNKKDREGAMAEGREIHITSLDSSIKEDEVKKIFEKYGIVERVRILKTIQGESKGAAFVTFEKKDEATAALELDKTKLKSKILVVEMSSGKNFKPTATSMGKASSASPAPDTDGDVAMSSSSAVGGLPANSHALHAPSLTEATNVTVCLMNIPDTVNDARIRAIAEQYGEIVKLVLRPDHQGAIIEYADAPSAGKAALALENHEIAPGRKLRTGGMKDLFVQKDEIKTDRITYGQGKKATSTLLQPSAPVRRPVAGRRGGLGQKREPKLAASSRADVSGDGVNGHEGDNHKSKSNADFKAMFIGGKAQ